MSKFADRNGVEWRVELTVGSLADVRQATRTEDRPAGIDLGKAIRDGGELMSLAFGDPQGLVEVLWVLASAQAEKAGTTPEQFARGFDGPALGRAGEALLEAVADFFPRSALGKALKTDLPTMLKRMDEAALKEMASRSNGSAGSSPAS